MSITTDNIPDDLTLAGGREMPYLPWHFIPVRIPRNLMLKGERDSKLMMWIWTQCTGRFYLQETDVFPFGLTIYLEDPSEAAALTLIIDSL